MRSIPTCPIRSALLLAGAIPFLPSRASAAPQSGPPIEVIEHCHNEGLWPASGVIQASDGLLYGTTTIGAANGTGAIFRLDLDGSNPTKIFDFGTANNLVNPNGLIEGSDGALYGTTRRGGANDVGMIYRIQRDGTGFTVLHDCDVTTGAEPRSRLIQAADGTLYGTTGGGGVNGIGTIFRLPTDGSWFALLYEFNASVGAGPYGLIQASDGWFYGTCSGGGANGAGSVFSLTSQTIGKLVLWTCATLVSFDPAVSGSDPESNLIEGTEGALYGMTRDGGTSRGTLWKVNKDGTGLTIVKFFDFAGGESPSDGSALIEGSDGALYGTTHNGGAYGAGTLFRCQKDGSGFQALSSFEFGGESGWPSGGLIQASDGALFGTTVLGDSIGGSNGGTVWRVDYRDATSTNYGSGLAGTLGIPTLTSSDPVIGGVFGITVDNSRGVPTGATLFAGFSRANIPVKGGTLLVGNVFFLLTTVIPAPTGTMLTPLPDDPALAGLVLDVQWIEADPGAVKGLSFTPGLELVLGW